MSDSQQKKLEAQAEYKKQRAETARAKRERMERGLVDPAEVTRGVAARALAIHAILSEEARKRAPEIIERAGGRKNRKGRLVKILVEIINTSMAEFAKGPFEYQSTPPDANG